MFLLTRCRISMCQGLGPQKHDEISEIDRGGMAPMSEWISESVSQWVSQSVSQSVSQWVSQSVSDWVNEWTSERVNEWTSERVSEWASGGGRRCLCSLSTANIYTYTPTIWNTVYLFWIRYCKYWYVDVYKCLSRTLAGLVERPARCE